MLIRADKFSKYVHGSAVLFPSLVSTVPYWLENDSGVNPRLINSKLDFFMPLTRRRVKSFHSMLSTDPRARFDGHLTSKAFHTDLNEQESDTTSNLGSDGRSMPSSEGQRNRVQKAVDILMRRSTTASSVRVTADENSPLYRNLRVEPKVSSWILFVAFFSR